MTDKEKLLANLKAEVTALWIECPQTSYGNGQRVAYDRVLKILDGKHPGINYHILQELEDQLNGEDC